jgi:hypothetical protein
MSEGMRLTNHNGRAGKSGAYSPKHNDRSFDTSRAEHIDEERSSGNHYMSCFEGEGLTFDEAEARAYEVLFSDSLQARNQRYIDQRHPERVQTMDAYRSNPRTCPEETIMQIGKEGQTVDPDLLWEICKEQIGWEIKTFPNVRILDLALHVDELGAPHIHERKVWIGHDKDGNRTVGQSKALAEMGIKPPEPDKPYGRHNNAKMSYTRLCRDHLAELCLQHGLEMELEPQEPTKSGLSLLEYQRRQEQEKLEQTKDQNQELRDENAALRAQNAQIGEVNRLIEESNAQAAKRLKSANNALKQAEADNARLADVREQLEEAERLLMTTKEVKRVKVPKPLIGNSVKIDRDELERLKTTAAEVDRMQERYAQMERRFREIDQIEAEAKQEAQEIIRAAQYQARSLKEQLAQSQLEDLKEDYPELFNVNGVYQRGYEQFREEQRQHSRDDYSISR